MPLLLILASAVGSQSLAVPPDPTVPPDARAGQRVAAFSVRGGRVGTTARTVSIWFSAQQGYRFTLARRTGVNEVRG